MRRRRAPFGRYLAAMPAELFLPNLPAPSAILVQGFTLAERTRPYLTQRGDLNVRLVFRERDSQQSLVVSFPLRGVVTAELRAALEKALPRGFSVVAATDRMQA